MLERKLNIETNNHYAEQKILKYQALPTTQ